MNRRSTIGAVAAAFLLCCSSLLMALPGTVTLKDGKSFTGDVTVRKETNKVDVVVEGKKYSFSMAIVADIKLDENAPQPTPGQPQPGQPQPGQPQPGQPQPGQPQPPAQPGMSPEEEFDKRMQALGPRDVAGRIKLAQWAVERKRYDMAQDALKQALGIDPRNREAQDFMKVVEAQQRLNQRQVNRPPQQGGPTTPSQPGAPRGEPPPMEEGGDDGRPAQPRAARGQGGDRSAGLRPLTPDEINRVRMLEWRRDDRGVNVRLLNNVKRRFLARARDVKPADFNAMTVTEQAQLIREQGTEDMLNDVRVVNDPPSLQEFRTGIQRPMLQTCASQQCHGGGEGSEKFALFHRAEKEPEAYANFLALSNYTGKAGGGGQQPKDEKQKEQKEQKQQKQQKQGGSILSSNEPREARMIDRNRPEDSLLIQYGLPYDAADAPHPEVPGFKPLFRTRNDARYRQFVRWVADVLAPIDQDYGIDMAAAPEEQAGARQVGREEPQGTDQAPKEGAGADEPQEAPPARAPAGRQPARGPQGQR